MAQIAMNLLEGRPRTEVKTWDLPAWGHPLSRIVLPLFIRSENELLPAGTAFWVGRNIPFVLTAMHTVKWAMGLEGRFDQALSSGELPTAPS